MSGNDGAPHPGGSEQVETKRGLESSWQPGSEGMEWAWSPGLPATEMGDRSLQGHTCPWAQSWWALTHISASVEMH